MTALPVVEAAKVLGIPPGTLRRWCRENCPHRPGRRGRGGALLVDPEEAREWHEKRKFVDPVTAAVKEIAHDIPLLLAAATLGSFKEIKDDPAKCRMAGILAASWLVQVTAMTVYLRKFAPSLPEVTRPYPDEVQYLEHLAESNEVDRFWGGGIP